MDQFTVEFVNRRAVCTANIPGALGYKVKNRLRIAGGGRHSLQNTDGGGVVRGLLVIVAAAPRHSRVTLLPQLGNDALQISDRRVGIRYLHLACRCARNASPPTGQARTMRLPAA